MRGAVLVLALAACGDNQHGVTLEDFEAAAREASCRYIVQCGLLPDLAACAQSNFVAANYYSWTLAPELVAAVHAGTAIWSPAAAAACLNQPRSCDTTNDANLPVCAPFTSPTLHDGDACMVSAECISNECWTDYSTEACHVGYCVGDTRPVPGHLGDVCRLSGCLEGFCDDSICRPRLVEGAECRYSKTCAEGLACVLTVGSELGGRCLKLPGTGEQCGTRCARYGDRCRILTGVCEPIGALHDACVQDNECSPFYRCLATSATVMQCELPGRALLGDPCGLDSDCIEPETYCHRMMGRCVDVPPPYTCD